MSYLNRNRLKNFFINLKKYFKSEEFLNSMAISNAEIDNIANTAGYNDNGTGTVNYDFVPRSGGAVMTGSSLGRTVNDSELRIDGGTSDSNGSAILLRGKDKTGNGGETDIVANDGTDSTTVNIKPNGTITRVTNNVTKNVAMQEDVVPRSGGAVLEGNLGRTTNDTDLVISGGQTYNDGAFISLKGKFNSAQAGFALMGLGNGSDYKYMQWQPNGTWIWTGTAVQIISDQRLKQQIAEIDDKLLDAWEDVDLVQFKYNDAVDQKGKDKARFHAGYVVQQIDSACKSHGVDISQYGLYCHEEYPQETEEVEVEQADGTKTKERKVIREASEHYSLRYTEVYAIECAYLRKRIKELEERLEKLEGNSK